MLIKPLLPHLERQFIELPKEVNPVILPGLFIIVLPEPLVVIARGKSGVEFNAHRVFEANEIIEIFRQNNCELTEFSLVDDFGELHINCEIKDSKNLNFGGGIFTFTKK